MNNLPAKTTGANTLAKLVRRVILVGALVLLMMAPSDAASFLERGGKETVMVIFIAKKGAEDYTEYAENVMKDRLKRVGFRIMNPEMTDKVKKDRLLFEAIRNANATEMARIGTDYGAGILVRGTLAAVTSNERFAGTWEGNASISVVAIDTRTGEELETVFSDPMGSTDNPLPMEDSSLTAKQLALRKAIDNLLVKLGGDAETLSPATTLSPSLYAVIPTEGGGDVRHLLFSPDDRFVVASCDKAVFVWDTATRALVRTFKGYGGRAGFPAFNRDSSLLAVATTKGRVLLLKWPTGDVIKTLDAHDGEVSALDFSPDSRLLATGGDDGTVRVWDTATGRRVCEPSGHSGRVVALSFDASGKRLVTVSNDLTIRTWDVNTGKELRAFNESMDKLSTAAFSNDRSLVAYGATAVDIDLLRNRRTDKKYIRLRDTLSGLDLFTFEGHAKDITAVAFFPGKRFVVSSALDKTIKIWDCEKRGEVVSLEQEGAVAALAVSRDGKWLGAGVSGNITIWRFK